MKYGSYLLSVVLLFGSLSVVHVTARNETETTTISIGFGDGKKGSTSWEQYAIRGACVLGGLGGFMYLSYRASQHPKFYHVIHGTEHVLGVINKFAVTWINVMSAYMAGKDIRIATTTTRSSY